MPGTVAEAIEWGIFCAMTRAASVAEVVANGLCVGCGLCEAVTAHRVTMRMNERGTLRPHQVDTFTSEEERVILGACPGTIAQSRLGSEGIDDEIWGRYSRMAYAWAGDPDVRFEAATGGVLTALAMHLVSSGVVDFVLQVEADPKHPMRSRWVMNETAEAVRASAGSRYGPTAPLAGLVDALDRDQSFALVAKPCDLGAVHAYSSIDPRVDRLCVARLTMVCGGQSSLEKSVDVLDDLGLTEPEVSLFRYRGFGNPGPTRVETTSGAAFELSYNQMWDDQAGWKLESRCTLCPDALGETADVAAGDVWPGGGPTGEDEGFNGIIVRTEAGAQFVSAAVDAGAVVLGDPITPREYDEFQPHQVRKKVALSARNEALESAGKPTISSSDLRVGQLGARMTDDARHREIEGTSVRISAGRYS
ncbi:MAG: Coenzyme F420 hydrogenase/dehydrogenase, beta subunit C-terminal domain [Acidimicrobiales bacterium]